MPKAKDHRKVVGFGVFFCVCVCVDMSVLGCLLQVNDVGETNGVAFV